MSNPLHRDRLTRILEESAVTYEERLSTKFKAETEIVIPTGFGRYVVFNFSSAAGAGGRQRLIRVGVEELKSR